MFPDTLPPLIVTLPPWKLMPFALPIILPPFTTRLPLLTQIAFHWLADTLQFNVKSPPSTNTVFQSFVLVFVTVPLSIVTLEPVLAENAPSENVRVCVLRSNVTSRVTARVAVAVILPVSVIVASLPANAVCSSAKVPTSSPHAMTQVSSDMSGIRKIFFIIVIVFS